MIRYWPIFIGLRYIRSKKQESFFSLISFLSFSAMTLGVAALIIVLAVMNGFDREIKQRILNVVPHITLHYANEAVDWKEQLRLITALPNVAAASPFVDGQAMLSANGQLQGVSVQGVEAANSTMFSALEPHMLAGSFDLLQAGDYGVVIGSLLARSLNVMTGDPLLLTLPQVSLTPAGVFPRVKRLTVVGVYQVGAQVDSGIALVHIADAQKLFRQSSPYEGIRLRLKNPFEIATVNEQLATILPATVSTSTWQSAMKTLFAAIKMEKTVVGLLLAVIIAVAGFNIIASLVLMVAGKGKDIAVLRAMGANSGSISLIFLVQGAVSGIAGVMIGVVFGCALAWQLGDIVVFLEQVLGLRLFDPNVYFISQLPTDLRLNDVLVIGGFGILVSLLATLYPAYRAGQISPAEVLRYEL